MNESDHTMDLKRKFPNMKPSRGAPTLFTLNGCGLGMYGRRNEDAETGSYLKARCVCLVFVPLIALDTYRVVDAEEGGWYFLGKERTSKFARLWRMMLIAGVLSLAGGGAWDAHLNSPGYRMGKAREEAAGLVGEGKAMDAVKVYDGMLADGIGNAREWREKIGELLVSEIGSGDFSRVSSAVSYADQHRSGGVGGGSLVPDLADLADLALSAVESESARDGEMILASFTPDPDELARVNDVRRGFLEEVHKESPDDHDVTVKLALIRESAGELDGALELLEPAAGALGDGEGARLYGMLLMGEGRSAEALAHLERYVEPRLKRWKYAEKIFQREYEAGQERALNRLNGGQGPHGFEIRYEAASEAEQQRMVDEYLSERLLKDIPFIRAREAYEGSTGVVPVIMEIGIAKLRIAQAEADPVRRKSLLGEAEKTFLSLQDVAGETDEYRIFLGQVYYWSGRGNEGRELFDALLDDSGRKFENLYGVASMLRDLGESEQARELVEEAFEKAEDPAQKTESVVLRSMLSKDLDDKIEWLEKGESSAPAIEAGLAEANAQRAEEKGDIKAAAVAYRKALAVYEKQSPNSAQLNNSALIYRSLHRLEGNPDDFEKAARLLSKAVALEPNDSILSSNAAESYLMVAVLGIVDGKVDPKIIQNGMNLHLLRFLYRDEVEKAELMERLTADPNYRKSLKYSRDAMILAPKNPGSYTWLAHVLQYVNDEKGMADVIERARGGEFDFSDAIETRARFLKGETDEKLRKANQVSGNFFKELAGRVESERAKAMVASYAATIKLNGFPTDEDPDFKEWMPSLESAAETAKCSAVDATLVQALEIQAIEELAKDDAEVAEVVDSARRHLSPSSILRMLVRADGEMGGRVRQHQAVVRAREYSKILEKRFPNWVTGLDWALLSGLEGADSEDLLRRLLENRMERHRVELAGIVSPKDSPAVIIAELWLCLAEGDRAGVEERVSKLEAVGIKVPPLI